MMVKIVTALALRLDRQKDAPERPLIAPPCQSEIKRTLRPAIPPSKTVSWRGFARREKVHSVQMVNVRFPERVGYGFEMVDAADVSVPLREAVINRKFTPNRMNRIFCKFSPLWPQCEHLRFIDGC